MDESSLIQQVQEGDVDAFGRLMDLHVRRLRAFIALSAPVPHLIDEVCHEAFVFAYRNIGEFKRGTAFFSWLKAIAWNLMRQEIQRYSRGQAQQARYAEQRVVEMSPVRPQESAGRELDGLELCLEKVPPRMRDLLQMKYTAACSTEEIAEKFTESSAWVRTTLFRLRRQLKECVERRLATEQT